MCRHVFKWGVSEELVPNNIYSALTTVPPVAMGETNAVEACPRTTTSDEIFSAVINHLRGFYRDIALVLRYTAMRPIELIRMTVGEVHTDDSGVLLYIPVRHKNSHRGKSRIIPFGPRATEVIRPYLQGKPSEAFVFAKEDSLKNLYDSKGMNNRPREEKLCGISEPAFRKALRQAFNESINDGSIPADTPMWTPYSIRHLAITEMGTLEGVVAGQRLAGHSQLRTTEIYSHQELTESIALAMKHG